MSKALMTEQTREQKAPAASSAFSLPRRSSPHNPRAQLRQNAAFMAQMEAQSQEEDTEATLAAAAQGVRGSGGALPYLETIQRSFGHHDVSQVQAFLGGQAKTASEAIGALAYASGNAVAFREAPSLHTAAHEAAHIVQQRHGVQLQGGVGQVGDRYEVHADAVADRVVQGKDASDLLDAFSGRTAGAGVQRAVQRKRERKPATLGIRAALKRAGVHLDAALQEVPFGESQSDDGQVEAHSETLEAYRAMLDPAGVDVGLLPLPDMPRMPSPAFAARTSLTKSFKPSVQNRSVGHKAAEELAQASLELDDARSVLQSVCDTQGNRAQAFSSSIDAFLQTICEDELNAARAPRAYKEGVSDDELAQVERARAEIELKVIHTHERTFTNPEFMRILPHYRKTSAPRNRIFGPSLKIIQQQAKGAKTLASQEATLMVLKDKAKALKTKIEAQTETAQALEQDGSQKQSRRTQGVLKQAHARLARLRKRIEIQSAIVAKQAGLLDSLAASLRTAAQTARETLIIELTSRISDLEEQYAKRAALAAQLSAAKAEKVAMEEQLARSKSKKGLRARLSRVRRKIRTLKRALKAAAKRLAKAEKRADLSELQVLAERAQDAPMVSTLKQTDYQGKIDGRSHKLLSPRPGHLALDRPSGFGVGGRQKIPEDVREDAAKEALGIEGGEEELSKRDRQRLDAAMGAMSALGCLEGRADSVNTWDNVILTLGPGLTGSGVLQRAFWHLRTESPETFRVLFGRFGIDVHQRGQGRYMLSVVDPESKARLSGKRARTFIANSPQLLIVCRDAGRHKDWQRALAFAKAGYSIKAGIDFEFDVTLTTAGRSSTMRLSLVDVLRDASAELRGMALAAIADRKHAGGGTRLFKKKVPELYLEILQAQGKGQSEDERVPRQLSRDEPNILAARIFNLIPANRSKRIQKAFNR